MKKDLVLKVLKSGGKVSKGVGTKLSPKIPRGSGWDYLTSEVHKVHDKLLNVRNLEHDLNNHGAEYHDAMLKMIKMFQKDTEGIGSLRNYFMNVKESDIFTHPLYVQGEMKIHDMVEFDPVTSTLLKSIELKSKLEGS